MHRKHGFAMAIDEIQQCAAQLERRGHQAKHKLALPHPIHRHVDVVARASGVQPPRHVLSSGTARFNDQALDVEEEIFIRAVVLDTPDIVERNRVERVANRPAVRFGNNALLDQHHQMGVVDRHHRREEKLFGVFEVFVQDAADVFRREAHVTAVYLASEASDVTATDAQRLITEHAPQAHQKPRRFVEATASHCRLRSPERAARTFLFSGRSGS